MQGREGDCLAEVELDPQWAEALEGVSPGDYLWIIWWLERTAAVRTRIHPRGDPSRPLTGLFKTRSPNRPNPLALNLVRVEAVEGSRLRVRWLEAAEGSAVVDIKPFLPEFDCPTRKGVGSGPARDPSRAREA